MQYILDNPQIESEFQQILKEIKQFKNGVVSDAQLAAGYKYDMNYGVSILHLREIAQRHTPNHLLALKLWNRGWRETLILATLLEEPNLVSNNQLDYWVKSITTIEMAEQLSLNLVSHHPNAIEKAEEWALGKKRLVKITGLLTFGNIATTLPPENRDDIEVIFGVLPPLIKDRDLKVIIIRVLIRVARIDTSIRELTVRHANNWLLFPEPNAQIVAKELFEELKYC